jgi:cobalamin biosynthesis Mg chelatase CobN
MLGTFASFGGVGYAASGASKVVTRIVSVSHTKATVHVRGLSAASDQYKPSTTPKVNKKVKPLQVKGALVTQKTSSGKLPFTGISLLTTVFLGLALIVLGMILRRREAKQQA